jgi:hypothetical protein
MLKVMDVLEAANRVNFKTTTFKCNSNEQN